jgi:hypothetical protein
MPSGCAQYIRDIFRRLDKEHKLCPDGKHDYGDWGEWHFRRWRKSRKPYEIRFKRCRRCRKTLSEINEHPCE